MGKLREVLKKPDFFFLWLGQVISQFGDKFAIMALVGLGYKRAPGSAYELAKIFIFIIVPVFIVGPVAGVYADRWNRKYTMLISDVARGMLVLLIAFYWALFPELKPIFPVYLLIFILFSVTRFFIPAKMAIIPDLVPEDKLLEANSLVHTTGMIAAALGFGLGGIIISLPSVGIKGGLLIDAATFFVSAFLIAFIRIKKQPLEEKENIYEMGRHVKEIIKTSVLGEVIAGIRYLFSHRKMHFIIALLFVVSSGLGALYVVLIIFIQQTLASMTKDLGLLAMLFGTGLFCGSIIYGKFGQKFSKTRIILLSLILGGIFLAQFVTFVSMYRNFYLAAAIAFLMGVVVSPIIISSTTIVHEFIPDELRGRVFSSIEAVMHLAFLIFMLAVSILAEFINTSYILITVGAVFIYFGISGMRLIKTKEAQTKG
jgi:MFS family permease